MSDQDNKIPEYRQGTKDIVEKKVDPIFGRTKWEVSQVVYDEVQEKEDKMDNGMSRTTRMLQARTESLGLDDLVGKEKEIIVDKEQRENNMRKGLQDGFQCKLCDFKCMDSNSWLDHLNSRYHNRLLGMNNKVEKVHVNKVQEKLSQIRKKNEPQLPAETMEEIQARVELEMQKNKEKKLQKQKKKQWQQQQELDYDSDNNEELQQMKKLGLPLDFDSKKIKK